jgi:hypothetical protein
LETEEPQPKTSTAMKTIALGKILSILLLFLASASNLFGWHVVYKHSAIGRSVEGSIDALTDAIRDGKSIKVMVDATSTGGNEIFLTPSSVQIDGNEVICQGSYFDIENPTPFKVYTQIKTDGVFTRSSWNIGTNTMQETRNDRFPVTWFVQD